MDKTLFRFMKHESPPYQDCMDYLWFYIGKFHFRWFTDCGDWFVYFEWWNKQDIHGLRFSSAGNFTY